MAARQLAKQSGLDEGWIVLGAKITEQYELA